MEKKTIRSGAPFVFAGVGVLAVALTAGIGTISSYLMYVANSVCSYLLSYKNSIYLAYQKAYVRNLWAQLCDAVKTLFQIVLIVLTGNFILYLAVQFVMQFIPNIIVSVKVDKEFPYLKECRELPEKEKFHGILITVLRLCGAISVFLRISCVITMWILSMDCWPIWECRFITSMLRKGGFLSVSTVRWICV